MPDSIVLPIRMAHRQSSSNVTKAANPETRTPHLVSLMVDDIVKYSDSVSKAFDVAHKLNATPNDLDEAYVSLGSTGNPVVDQTLQDLDLRLRVLQGQVEGFKPVNFYAIQTISDELNCKYATPVTLIVQFAEFASRSRCITPGTVGDRYWPYRIRA